MSLRITEGMVSRRVVGDLQRTRSKIAQGQEQISSGKAISRPSDDPLGAERALRLKADLAETRQNQRNVADAQSWLTITDDALGSIGEVVQRSRELAVQGLNGTLSATDRAAMAKEVEGLIAQAKSSANARFGDQYVFSGQSTDVRPYDPDGGDAYAVTGATPVVRTIGPGVSIQLSVIGKDVLGDDNGGVLKDLRSLVAHLSGGTPADVDSLRQDLSSLDGDLSTVTDARAATGALSNRLDAAKSRLDQLEFTTDSARSDVEDADLAKTYIDLTTQQTVYQAALQTSSRIMQQSLMDFLR